MKEAAWLILKSRNWSCIQQKADLERVCILALVFLPCAWGYSWGSCITPQVKTAGWENYCINTWIWKTQLGIRNWSTTGKPFFPPPQSLGGSPLTGAKLQDCISRAITRHKEVKKLIDKVIKSIKPKWTKRSLQKWIYKNCICYGVHKPFYTK